MERRVNPGSTPGQRRVDAGSRLEFARGPYGKQTWFVYFGAAGRASRARPHLATAVGPPFPDN